MEVAAAVAVVEEGQGLVEGEASMILMMGVVAIHAKGAVD